MNKLIYFQMDL
ncbi:hypothetical protein FOXB_09283 [Fusarium oxysporum f. sp. conglutinans Fo5176]|uniref:Uncharacterized protein n=1 Tax=Fusarium oxysporum (strain Fo5176) TaxID=660025 RepID=F9FSA2_FUSOF|nr:hypothetical protein FOXB_09283 [Fusarium oxysporum f. sp. conglutinans Fo5176]